MTSFRLFVIALFPFALAACTADQSSAPPDEPLPTDNGGPTAGTRPSGQPNLVTYEGTIEAGVECTVLRTAEGERWAFNSDADLTAGDRVSIAGEVADASFCQEGRGTLIVESISVVDRPAGD